MLMKVLMVLSAVRLKTAYSASVTLSFLILSTIAKAIIFQAKVTKLSLLFPTLPTKSSIRPNFSFCWQQSSTNSQWAILLFRK